MHDERKKFPEKNESNGVDFPLP